ncbi:helix-turn-helix domain-containing protein [Salinimicrobium catena]|uniref:helix-turn-helix domain-containing protein n=1 Tax=Salinimicrobium catena TaxID=390640 RepID=UPI002FE4570E
MGKSGELEVTVAPKGQLEAIQETLDRLNKTVEELKRSFEPKQPEEYLTRQEASDLLKINLSTLWNWTTKKKRLKSYSLCGKVYYRRSEIEKLMSE